MSVKPLEAGAPSPKYREWMARVGERVRSWRSTAGMDVGPLAVAAGLPTAIVRAIEGGDYSPSFKVRDKIARALGSSEAEMFGDIAAPESEG